MTSDASEVLRLLRHRESALKDLADAREALDAARVKRDAAQAMLATLNADLAPYLTMTIAELVTKVDTDVPPAP